MCGEALIVWSIWYVRGHLVAGWLAVTDCFIHHQEAEEEEEEEAKVV